MNDIGNLQGEDRTDGSGTTIFFFFFPYRLIHFWSILLLGYVWVRTFFFHFSTLLVTVTFARASRSRVDVRVVSVPELRRGSPPAYLNPFESWVLSTCSTERKSFSFSYFLYFVFHLSFHLFLFLGLSLDRSRRIIILVRFFTGCWHPLRCLSDRGID